MRPRPSDKLTYEVMVGSGGGAGPGGGGKGGGGEGTFTPLTRFQALSPDLSLRHTHPTSARRSRMPCAKTQHLPDSGVKSQPSIVGIVGQMMGGK